MIFPLEGPVETLSETACFSSFFFASHPEGLGVLIRSLKEGGGTGTRKDFQRNIEITSFSYPVSIPDL